MLKAKSPDDKEKRLKLFVYGAPGIGKTLGVVQFPNAYIIDTERGTDFYGNTIRKNGSVVFQSANPDDIKEELRSLLIEKHQYKTLVIDPITQVYNAVQEKWTRVFEKHAKTEKEAEVQDFGMRYWGRVKSDFKSIQRLLMALDMNVLITSHQKDIYGTGMTKIGVGPDTMKGDEYIFDLVFHLQDKNGKRIAQTIKERAEIESPKFPAEFEWNYQNFLNFYGKEIIEREAKPVEMATPEHVRIVKALVEALRVEDTTIAKWFQKADVDAWEEMNLETIVKCIAALRAKVPAVAQEPEPASSGYASAYPAVKDNGKEKSKKEPIKGRK